MKAFWIWLWLCGSLLCANGDLVYDRSALHSRQESGCYIWYTKVLTGTAASFEVPPFTNLEVRVWVVDPRLLSPEEQQSAAVLPSPTSTQLTSLFYHLGEVPTLSFFSNISPSTPACDIAGYNTSLNYWTFHLSTEASGLFPVIVNGKGISILGCRTASQILSLSVKAMEIITPAFAIVYDSAVDAQLSFTFKSPGEYALHTSSCSPNIAVVVLDSSSFIFTQSNFARSQIVRFATTPLNGELIVDIIPIETGLVVLTQTKLYIVPLEEGAAPIISQGVPVPFSISKIQISLNCDQLSTRFGGSSNQGIDINGVVFAWDGATDVSEFYVSTDSANSFSMVQITLSSVKWRIHSITILPNKPYYTLLVSSSICEACVLMHNYKYNIWRFGASLPDGSLTGSGDSLKISTTATGADILYMWGQLGDLFYSADGGMSLQPLHFLDSSDIGVLAFASSAAGQIAVLTQSGRVLYGLTDLQSNIQRFVSPNTPTFINFDSFGRLMSVTLSAAGTVVNYTDILGEPDLVAPCPFIDFSTDFPPYHYLDMNEVATVTINITMASTPRTKLVQPGYDFISMALANIDLFSFNLSFAGSNEQASLSTYQYLLNLTERATDRYSSYAERVANAQGNTDVRITPSTYSLGCPYIQEVQRARIGCPPYRSLVISVDGKIASCPSCAVSQYYGSLFRPIVMVYDGADQLTEVLVNYVMWEVYDRTDYSFNLTMHQAGCRVPAQKTKDFPAFKQADGSVDRKWGPATYKSCFAGEPTKVPDAPYEIINASSFNNAVIFLGGGLYTFRVRVVDPTYSYCDLTADITVNVYGAPLSAGYSAAIVVGTSLVIVASLTISYLTYKKTQKIL